MDIATTRPKQPKGQFGKIKIEQLPLFEFVIYSTPLIFFGNMVAWALV